MKNLFYFIIIVGFLLLFNSNDKDQYDKGYETAWQDKEPSVWANKQEKNGYYDGLDDSWMYDEGYDDGLHKKSKRYPNNSFYIEGYKDGKQK
ncbi:hypothetical protein KAT08_03470 [Candidatus Babeliales bacterium]|nr:hypothetical protein [Candidatus Babeliales bacterium]